MVATSDILICDNVFMNRDTPVFACDTYVKLKKDRYMVVFRSISKEAILYIIIIVMKVEMIMVINISCE